MSTIVMNETRLTAALPQLDVEIVRREEEDPVSEMVVISVRAKPGFAAVADHLAPRLVPFALGSMLAWWTPWLTAALPWLALPRNKDNGTADVSSPCHQPSSA